MEAAASCSCHTHRPFLPWTCNLAGLLALAALGREKEPPTALGRGGCFHANAQTVDTAALKTVCFIWNLLLGHRKAANHVVWYKATAKGLQEIPYRPALILGCRLPCSS